MRIFPLALSEKTVNLYFMSTREHLLAEIESFLTWSGMSPSEFGMRVAKDTSFVPRLRAGHDVRTATADRVFAFIRAHRTSGAPRTRPRKARQIEAAA